MKVRIILGQRISDMPSDRGSFIFWTCVFTKIELTRLKITFSDTGTLPDESINETFRSAVRQILKYTLIKASRKESNCGLAQNPSPGSSYLIIAIFWIIDTIVSNS